MPWAAVVSRGEAGDATSGEGCRIPSSASYAVKNQKGTKKKGPLLGKIANLISQEDLLGSNSSASPVWAL